MNLAQLGGIETEASSLKKWFGRRQVIKLSPRGAQDGLLQGQNQSPLF